jgi:uncharacterized protein YggU (UPF0235/DUF167 family)
LRDFLEIKEKTAFLSIKVIPNNPKTEIIWIMEDWTLKIKAKWIPENWKVNKEIIKFFSKELGISRDKIKIIKWWTSRNKLLRIDF